MDTAFIKSFPPCCTLCHLYFGWNAEYKSVYVCRHVSTHIQRSVQKWNFCALLLPSYRCSWECKSGAKDAFVLGVLLMVWGLKYTIGNASIYSTFACIKPWAVLAVNCCACLFIYLVSISSNFIFFLVYECCSQSWVKGFFSLDCLCVGLRFLNL